MIQNELHASAYLLHPCTSTSKWEDPELRQGFTNLVSRWWPGEALQQHTILLQLDMFEREEGDFSKEAVVLAKNELLATHKMIPTLCWRMYDRHVGALADVAIKILSQPITSSDGERCFSIFWAVQTKKRRKLCCKKMVQAMNVAFPKQSLDWAEQQATNRNKVIAQCALQSVEDAAADSLTGDSLGGVSFGGSTASSSSPQSVVITEGSSSSAAVTRWTLLLGPNHDNQSFVLSEFQRARVQLPLINTSV